MLCKGGQQNPLPHHDARFPFPPRIGAYTDQGSPFRIPLVSDRYNDLSSLIISSRVISGSSSHYFGIPGVPVFCFISRSSFFTMPRRSFSSGYLLQGLISPLCLRGHSITLFQGEVGAGGAFQVCSLTVFSDNANLSISDAPAPVCFSIS